MRVGLPCLGGFRLPPSTFLVPCAVECRLSRPFHGARPKAAENEVSVLAMKQTTQHAAIAALSVLLTMTGLAFAQETEDEVVESEVVDPLVHLRTLRPELDFTAVRSAPAEGLYRVEIGAESFYITADGRYLIAGDMYRIDATALRNVDEERRTRRRAAMIEALPEGDAVTFTPPGGAVASVNVFTDVDCGYCQMLHQSMADYHDRGIEIRYLAYPRGGEESETWHRMVSAWCADDRGSAITALKAGDEIPNRTCENPVARHYEIGVASGVTGTPSLVLPDGTMVPGLVAAEELAELLELSP